MDITSEHTILRPAAHMPVNSWHRAQKPSRIATGSWVGNPQSGHDQPPVLWLALLRAAMAAEIRAATLVISDLPLRVTSSLAKLR